jgi:dCTP deaminase
MALGSASIDVRLGQKFRIPKRTKITHLDHSEPDHQMKLDKYKEETFVPIGDKFVLHPKQFVLGETLEWVHLPHDLAAYVIGRSSWGRDGLIIATATGVHPGYSGILTLEISNIGEIPISLWPGLTIAQLFIERVEGAEVGDRDPSSLRGSTEPRNVNAAADDKDIIKRFKDAS